MEGSGKCICFKAYHGTGTLFQKFDCPAYFADSYSTAAFFANRNNHPKVYDCSLVFKKPLIVDLEGQSWGGFHLRDASFENDCIKYIANGDEEEEAYFQEYGLTVGYLADYAMYTGYDGIIAYGCYEEDNSTSTQYVCFNPENIKIMHVSRAM